MFVFIYFINNAAVFVYGWFLCFSIEMSSVAVAFCEMKARSASLNRFVLFDCGLACLAFLCKHITHVAGIQSSNAVYSVDLCVVSQCPCNSYKSTPIEPNINVLYVIHVSSMSLRSLYDSKKNFLSRITKRY